MATSKGTRRRSRYAQRFSYLPKFLTEDEINRLFAAPDISTDEIRDRALLEIMYAAGLRVSELVSLKQSDVDLHTGMVVCHGKGSKRRRVPLGKVQFTGYGVTRLWLTVNRIRPSCFCSAVNPSHDSWRG